jgi:hypothetical protein
MWGGSPAVLTGNEFGIESSFSLWIIFNQKNKTFFKKYSWLELLKRYSSTSSGRSSHNSNY